MLDIGAAEGLITLRNIDNVQHAYCFEGDAQWWSPLEKTFEGYADKVSIVKKYVSDVDDDSSIRLDTFIREERLEQEPLFIKMDIEGMEMQVLKNIAGAIARPGVKMSICTYHRPDDAVEIPKYLESLGFVTRFTPGYMFVNMNSDKYSFRKGVLYAEYGHWSKE